MLLRFIQSFGYAFCGIWYCITQERNYRVHIVAAVTVLAALRHYSLLPAEKAAIVIVICLVFVCETINTAIERLGDEVTKERRPLLRACKDAVAGAVLISAACAVSVAFLLLWDTEIFGQIIQGYLQSPLKIACLILYVAAGITFVFLPERNER